jgi:PST family polysaccharide transporter
MSAQELSPPAADAEDLGDRTARAAGWRLAATLATAVSRFLVGVLLSRLLTPSDFGISAIAFVVLGFVQPVQDLGIGAAVVQRRYLTSRHVRAAFTFSTLLGLATAAALILVAPLVAIVMRDARVTPVLRVLSAGLALQAPGGVAGALLRRRLDFRRVFFVDTASYMVGYGVSIGLALLGKGVWSLVWGGFVQGTLLSAFQLAVVRHSVRPLLNTRETRDLLHFGVGWGASNWINYLALNADNFLVGRMLGAASLGLYARAYTLMSLPSTHMASLLSGVLFPAFAEIQADRARLRRAYLVITQLIAIVAAASMATMVIVAPHLVRSLYGLRWMGVVAPLQILCGAGYFRALYHVGGVVAQSAGQVYRDLRRQALYATLVVTGALVGSFYDLRGVAVGVSLAILVMFAATGQLALSITGAQWRMYARVQLSALVVATATGSFALAARMLLEHRRHTSAVIAAGTLASAALPWTLGALWKLGDPDLRPLRARLPRWCNTAVEFVAHLSA